MIKYKISFFSKLDALELNLPNSFTFSSKQEYLSDALEELEAKLKILIPSCSIERNE